MNEFTLSKYLDVTLFTLECKEMKPLSLFIASSIFVLNFLSAQSFNETYFLSDAKVYTSLQEALREPNKVVHLELKNQQLKQIPKRILSFRNLRVLDLSNNQISKIDEENFYGLQKLEGVLLANNLLRTPPIEALKKCSELRYLDLGNNRIQSIEELDRLKYLEVLKLNDNQIKTIPSNLQLKYLRYFRIDGNQLKQLPSFLRYSKKLNYLNLYGNQVNTLSLEMITRSNLQSLNIGNNPIKTISTIQQLTQLETLILDWIPLEESDVQAISSLSELQILSMEHCDLKALPSSFGQLQRLREVSLIANQLETLPESLSQLQSLEKLWLKGNSLPPSNLQSVRAYLPNCQILH